MSQRVEILRFFVGALISLYNDDSLFAFNDVLKSDQLDWENYYLFYIQRKIFYLGL